MIDIGGGSYAFTDIPFYVSVGKYASIAEGCIFVNPMTHLCIKNRKCVYTTNWDQPDDVDRIIIGNDVWIGQGVKIIPPITIGDGAIIGAFSVIAKNVEPYSVVVGNPQVVKKYRFTPEQIEKLEEIKWWNWDRDIIDSRKEDMKDIDLFLEKYYEE